MPRREQTVVLHVGVVPGASRLIQRCLASNSAQWPPRAHVLTNAVLQRDLGSGPALVSNPENFAATLRRAFDQRDVEVVIGSRSVLGRALGGSSGAGLFPEAGSAIQAMAEATRGYRCVIVLSICPQAQFIEMRFQEMASGRGTTPISVWLSLIEDGNLSWLPLHDKLTAAFGSEHLVVHNFRPTEGGRIDFLRDTLAAAGLQLPEAVAKKSLPPSLRLSETGVRLAIVADEHLHTENQRADFHAFLSQQFSELDGPPGSVLTADQEKALHQRYDGELEILGADTPTTVGVQR
jgi:hypothetical protein